MDARERWQERYSKSRVRDADFTTLSGMEVEPAYGTADSELTGTIYFKSQPVAYAGNFSGQEGCTRVVADTIEWTGSTTLNQDCTKLGMKDVMSSQIVKLAE